MSEWMKELNEATGTYVMVLAPKETQQIRLPHHVEGLKAFECGSFIRFRLTSAEEINEPVAIDAQCRAGWNDGGYGFYGMTICQDPITGIWIATWKCGTSCD